MTMLLLIVSLLVALPGGSTNPADDMTTLSFENVIQLFGAIAQPFDETKEILNNFTTFKVEQIIEKIKLIAPAIKALHQTVDDVSTEIPLHRSRSEQTITSLIENLQAAQTFLRDLFQNCKELDVSPLALDTEEVVARTDESHGGAREGAAGVHPSDISGGDQPDLEIPALTVNFGQGQLDALIGHFGRDRHITITDAAQAFLKIAELIGQKHRGLFLIVAPKITEVGINIRDILVNLQAAKEEVAALLQLSNELKSWSHQKINLAADLSGAINRNVQRLTCDD
ncbi:unnamed protein product [Lymnaea stagnalis]|uniref:Uncharacterized protein n=1 Tax=Lymnaea stagnalis TaxID=6523 RepID=A0AAV2H8Y0_LYMST